MPLSIFWLLISCQVKHFVCDYPLQTPWMLGKFKEAPDYYIPLAAHCLVQTFGTAIVLFGWTWLTHHKTPFDLMIALLVFQFAAHFIMDRIKASPDMLGRFKALSRNEFMALTSDPPFELTSNALEPMIRAVTDQEADNRRRGNKFFWWSLGFDQMVHHVTDLVIVYILLKY